MGLTGLVKGALLTGCLVATTVQAQTPAAPPPNTPPPTPTPAASTAQEPVESCATCLVVPPLTPILIEVLKPLGSAISNSGDLFPIRLAQPIMVNGVEAIPAGTPGLGEVVHAKKNGGAGAAGELVLAARYLEIGGRRLRLRSTEFAQSGQSRIDTAAIASTGLGIFSFLIKGGKITVDEGTVIRAKTAQAFSIEPAPVQPTAPVAPSAPAVAKASDPQ